MHISLAAITISPTVKATFIVKAEGRYFLGDDFFALIVLVPLFPLKSFFDKG